MEEYIRQRDKVLDYIDANLNRAMTLDELAAVSCYSKYHFSRLFLSTMGETVFQYIHRLRLERAAKWIDIEADTPITDIAYELGFSNCANFSRSFKEHFGSSPSRWRSARKELKSREMERLDIGLQSGDDNDRSIFLNDKDLSWPYELRGGIRVRVRIQDVGELPIVYLRYIGASLGSHERFEYAYESLVQWAVNRGLPGIPAGETYAVYHDNPLITDESKLRISVGFEAPAGVEAGGRVGKMALAGGKYAVAEFEYETRDEYISVYTFLYGYWLSRFGYIPDIRRYDHVCFIGSPSGKILKIRLRLPVKFV